MWTSRTWRWDSGCLGFRRAHSFIPMRVQAWLLNSSSIDAESEAHDPALLWPTAPGGSLASLPLLTRAGFLVERRCVWGGGAGVVVLGGRPVDLKGL